jgi:MFS family permease
MGGMLPFALALAIAPTAAIGLACLGIATFFAAFQGGIAGGVIQLMTPNQMRGQAVALYFLVANLLGMGLGPTAIAALTDYVFKDDAALNKSLALGAAILVPLGAIVLISGIGRVREAIAQAQAWD